MEPAPPGESNSSALSSSDTHSQSSFVKHLHENDTSPAHGERKLKMGMECEEEEFVSDARKTPHDAAAITSALAGVSPRFRESPTSSSTVSSHDKYYTATQKRSFENLRHRKIAESLFDSLLERKARAFATHSATESDGYQSHGSLARRYQQTETQQDSPAQNHSPQRQRPPTQNHIENTLDTPMKQLTVRKKVLKKRNGEKRGLTAAAKARSNAESPARGHPASKRRQNAGNPKQSPRSLLMVAQSILQRTNAEQSTDRKNKSAHVRTRGTDRVQRGREGCESTSRLYTSDVESSSRGRTATLHSQHNSEVRKLRSTTPMPSGVSLSNEPLSHRRLARGYESDFTSGQSMSKRNLSPPGRKSSSPSRAAQARTSKSSEASEAKKTSKPYSPFAEAERFQKMLRDAHRRAAATLRSSISVTAPGPSMNAPSKRTAAKTSPESSGTYADNHNATAIGSEVFDEAPAHVAAYLDAREALLREARLERARAGKNTTRSTSHVDSDKRAPETESALSPNQSTSTHVSHSVPHHVEQKAAIMSESREAYERSSAQRVDSPSKASTLPPSGRESSASRLRTHASGSTGGLYLSNPDLYFGEYNSESAGPVLHSHAGSTYNSPSSRAEEATQSEYRRPPEDRSRLERSGELQLQPKYSSNSPPSQNYRHSSPSETNIPIALESSSAQEPASWAAMATNLAAKGTRDEDEVHPGSLPSIQPERSGRAGHDESPSRSARNGTSPSLRDVHHDLYKDVEALLQRVDSSLAVSSARSSSGGSTLRELAPTRNPADPLFTYRDPVERLAEAGASTSRSVVDLGLSSLPAMSPNHDAHIRLPTGRAARATSDAANNVNGGQVQNAASNLVSLLSEAMKDALLSGSIGEIVQTTNVDAPDTQYGNLPGIVAPAVPRTLERPSSLTDIDRSETLGSPIPRNVRSFSAGDLLDRRTASPQYTSPTRSNSETAVVLSPLSDDQQSMSSSRSSTLDAALSEEYQEHMKANLTRKVFRRAKRGDSRTVLKALQKGFPVNTKDDHGNTLISIAAQQGDIQLASLILKQGADVNTQNHRGQTPLHYCFQFGYTDLADFLLSHGADETMMNMYGLLPREGLRRQPARQQQPLAPVPEQASV